MFNSMTENLCLQRGIRIQTGYRIYISVIKVCFKVKSFNREKNSGNKFCSSIKEFKIEIVGNNIMSNVSYLYTFLINQFVFHFIVEVSIF